MSEWKLIDLCIGKGKYGIAAPSVPKNENLPTYLRITDINDDGTINKASLCSVDDENSTNYILEENDIVFARTGNSTGRSYFYNKNDGELVYAGFLIKFSLNPNIVNPVILKYYTHSKPYYDWIYSFDTGATRGNINAQTYANMPVILPERDIQDIIVPILSSLDAKIETNNKLNEKLEEMAQAIFKSWFVDFEPFKNQPFHETELGMIPDGWEVINIDCVYDIKYGNNLPTSEIKEKGQYPVYGANGVIGYFNTFNCNGYSVLITSRGNGSGDVYRTHSSKSFVTNNSFIVKTRTNYTWIELSYIYYSFLNINFKSYTNGSAQPQLTNKSIHNIDIVLPSKKDIENFCDITMSIINNIESLMKENARLASLRDTLLPRLMSGEIKI